MTTTQTNSEPTIIFLPGLGADLRLFKHQTAAFPNSIAMDWIDPLPDETLEQYAVRLADSVSQKFTTPPVVCGLSLGGMVAPYFAKRIEASGCILLCTVRSPREFPRRYRFGWLVSRYCPPLLWAFQFTVQLGARLMLLAPLFWRRLIDPEVVRQFAEMKTTKLVRLTKMMLEWAYRSEEKEPDYSGLRTVQVHGSRDSLLPISRTKPDHFLRGGHLLPLTHPNEINKIIREFLAENRLSKNG